MPAPPEVQAFANYLATIEDEDARKRDLRRATMLAINATPETAFEPPIRTLGQYLSDPIEVPPVLIYPKLCVRGGLNVTVGRAGKGKTVMNLNRMLRWSAGLPMFDGLEDKDGEALLAPTDGKPLKILIVENEGAAGLFHEQIGIMLHAEDYLDKESRALAKENILIWGEGGYSGLKLDDPAKLNGLRAGVEKWEPDIVFIEPFRSLWAGEENSSTEMNVVVDALIAIATDYNCGVWAAHHEKKGGAGEDDKMSASRGSTVLEGAVTVMENFESTKGGEQRELSWSKSRHGKAPNPVQMEWDGSAWWYKLVPVTAIEDDIITMLRENDGDPMNVSAMVEESDYTKKRLNEALGKMVKDGRIKKMPGEQLGHGAGTTGSRYRLPSEEFANTGGLPV